jgi:hypothetical protein
VPTAAVQSRPAPAADVGYLNEVSRLPRNFQRIRLRVRRGRTTSGLRHLGLRPEQRCSGECLTMAASARVVRRPDGDHQRTRVVRASVSKECRRRWERLRTVFRTDASACPHRAANRMWPDPGMTRETAVGFFTPDILGVGSCPPPLAGGSGRRALARSRRGAPAFWRAEAEALGVISA